jgi:alpha-beta hydrolase superfamily lysophospholipase
MDFSIRLSNNQLLRGFINSPGDNTRAGVIFVHGIGEHTGRYSNWVKRFTEKGIACAGVDLPGHGRSDGKRGYIKDYGVTREMLDIMVGQYRKTFPGTPLFLYGHSLGGGIVLQYIIESNPPLNGAVISSPFLKLAFEPARIKLILADVMKSIMPSLVQPSGLIAKHISHDQKVVDDYVNDPLVHDRISVSLYHSAMSAAAFALDKASEIKIPLFLIHGSDDLLTSPEGSRELASKNDKIQLRIWEGGYHELHNEPFKDSVFAEIMAWMNKNI